jgi:hypothetical protein
MILMGILNGWDRTDNTPLLAGAVLYGSTLIALAISKAK